MDRKLNGQKGIYDIVNKEKLDVVNILFLRLMVYQMSATTVKNTQK